MLNCPCSAHGPSSWLIRWKLIIIFQIQVVQRTIRRKSISEKEGRSNEKEKILWKLSFMKLLKKVRQNVVVAISILWWIDFEKSYKRKKIITKFCHVLHKLQHLKVYRHFIAILLSIKEGMGNMELAFYSWVQHRAWSVSVLFGLPIIITTVQELCST